MLVPGGKHGLKIFHSAVRDLTMGLPEIKHLFEPRTIAVIGASHDPSKIGYKILDNILSGGYSGRVFPVNPRGGELLGRDCDPGDGDEGRVFFAPFDRGILNGHFRGELVA